MSSLVRPKARQRFLALQTPHPDPQPTGEDRLKWIDVVCKNFVSHSKANKEYYKVVIEQLWPNNHGIPGPLISFTQLRDAINEYRKHKLGNQKQYKPYIDVFRRVRELQGEEGLIGVARQGNTLQLVDLKLGPKRIPRTKLNDSDWQKVLAHYHYKCAVCGRREPEVRFDQDHKVPRVRGGSDDVNNWQPLCGECNNFKSTSCRGCKLDCRKCPWAYPEKYGPLRVDSKYVESIRQLAYRANIDPHTLLNDLIKKALDQ